jgi:type IV pilus assembly protein PilP
VTRTAIIAGTVLMLARCPVSAQTMMETTAALDLTSLKEAAKPSAAKPSAEAEAPDIASPPDLASPPDAASSQEPARPEDAARPADAANPEVAAAEAQGEPMVGEPRDPFRPFTFDLRPEVPDDLPLTPLQRYELPQLRLAGVVLDLQTPRAMLQDNSGMGFIVTPGTPIGRRRGVVKSIEPRRVVVEETILDYYGREQVHQVAIEMAKDDKPQSANQE